MGRRRLPRNINGVLRDALLLEGEVAFDTEAVLARFGDGTRPGGITPYMHLTDVPIARYGGRGNNAFDNTAAFAAAVEEFESGALGSIRLRVPPGLYKLKGGPVQSDGFRRGVWIRNSGASVADPFGVQRRFVLDLAPGAVLVADEEDLMMVAISGQFTDVRGLDVINPGMADNVTGYYVGPQSVTDTAIRLHTNFNKLDGFSFQNLKDCIRLQAGPAVGGASSGCYYNEIANGQINNSQRGIVIHDGVAGSQGANRNQFRSMRIGSHVNTGLDVQAGDTLMFQGLHFEGCNRPDGPCEIPTAIRIMTAGPVSKWESICLTFVGCTGEANTRDIDSAQDDVSFIDCAFDWNDKCVFTQTPNLISGKPYGAATYQRREVRSYSHHALGHLMAVGSAITGVTTPEVTGDFRNGPDGAVVRAKGETGGAAEVRVDTFGGYGFFSMYQGGVAKWRLGSMATGSDHAAFMNPNGSVRVSIRSNGEIRPGADNARTLGSPSFRWGEIFCGNATINTSDKRQKDWRGGLSPAEMAAARTIAGGLGVYRWLSAVAEKGDAARLHCGVTAQAVMAAFEAEGLDATRYSLLCHDKWDETVEEHDAVYRAPPPGRVVQREDERDDEGRIVRPGKVRLVQPEPVELFPAVSRVVPAGDIWGVRYPELIAFMLAAQEARLQALEAAVGLAGET